MVILVEKLIIFDLDGTILDTILDLNAALNYVFAEFNLSKISVETTRLNLGNGIKRLIIDSKGSNENIDVFYNMFMEYYNKNYNVYTKPYDGIIDLLYELKNKGYKLAVISNKNIVPLKKLVDYHFNNIFDMVLGDGMGFKRKPDPEIINYCIDKLNSNISNTIYIGDSDIDINTVNNSKVNGLFVSYGYRKREILEQNGAKIIFDNVLELKDYLNKL